jgi:AmmeMemoRadiSam system protein A
LLPPDTKSPVASDVSETALTAPTLHYSPEQRRFLLGVAREAIAAALATRDFHPESPWAALEEPRGVFTTLYAADGLRGCVGHITADNSLVRAVAQTAVSAASSDPRFPPVTAPELPGIRIKLSVLSPLAPIAPREIEVGRHGLLVSMGHRRGLLLPEVPVELGWDRETFLAHTCRKAGLPPNAWMTGAELMGFTTESFGE